METANNDPSTKSGGNDAGLPGSAPTEAAAGQRSGARAAPLSARADEALNTVEQATAAELGRAPPLAIDAQVRADLGRLAALRARQHREAERVLDATRTKPAEPLEGVPPSPEEVSRRRSQKKEDEPLVTPEAARPARPLPKEVAENFVQRAESFFHRDDPKRLAFVDRGTALQTPSSNPELARALVAIAESRDWEGLKVRGSADFRREVFVEASARGMRVLGYTATQADLAEVQVRSERYTQRNTVEVTAARARADDFRTMEPEHALHRPELASAVVAADTLARLAEKVKDPVLRERLESGFRAQVEEGLKRGDTVRSLDDPVVGARVRETEGVIIEAHAAPYKDNPKAKESFVVRYLRSDDTVGERWGVELPKALEAAKAKIGDTVRLDYQGSTPVKVTEDVRDEKGRRVGTQTIDGHRNGWNVTVLARAPEHDVPSPDQEPRQR